MKPQYRIRNWSEYNALPLDIGSEAAVDSVVDSVVEEGSQGVIEAVFESVGSLFDGL